MRTRASVRRQAITAVLASIAFATTAVALPPLRPLDSSGRVTYFIADGEAGSMFLQGDGQLAAWALAAWQRALGGALHFESAPRAESLIQLFWVPARTGEFGE